MENQVPSADQARAESDYNNTHQAQLRQAIAERSCAENIRYAISIGKYRAPCDRYTVGDTYRTYLINSGYRFSSILDSYDPYITWDHKK